MSKPRPYTVAEMRDMFLSHLRAIVRDASRPVAPIHAEQCAKAGGEVPYKLDLLVFSILNMFDGTSMGTPALDIVARPHPEDREFHRANGENWWRDGAVLNGDAEDVELHEQWCGHGRGVK